MSKDCLYLNLWAPAPSKREWRTVLVCFYGGGFNAGDGSAPRCDGENMARQGIVAVTANYRLGVFGFFTHPALVRESPHHAAGNYGLSLISYAACEQVQVPLLVSWNSQEVDYHSLPGAVLPKLETSAPPWRNSTPPWPAWPGNATPPPPMPK